MLLALLVLPALASAQSTVFLRNDQNVTLDSTGTALTDAQALDLDLGERTLKTSTTGIRGVATSALGTLDATSTATLALGATYVRSSQENVSHLPLCVMSFFENGVGDCFFVPNPPIDNWDTLFSLNTISSFPYALDEVDSSGVVLNRANFESLAWKKTALSANSNSSLAVFEWIANITATTTPTNPNTTEPTAAPTAAPESTNTTTTLQQDNAVILGTVSVAFVQTSILGVVNLDDSAVLPKTWEIVVRVRSYHFTSTGNSLKLEVMAATGFGVDRTQAGIIALNNANDNKHWTSAYTQMATTATVVTSSGATTGATIKPTTFNLVLTPSSVAHLDFAPIVAEQLTVRYGTFGVWRSNATFPVGAANFDYQIRSGIGPILDALPIQVTPRVTSPGSQVPTGQLSTATSAHDLPHTLLAAVLLSFALLYLF